MAFHFPAENTVKTLDAHVSDVKELFQMKPINRSMSILPSLYNQEAVFSVLLRHMFP